MHRDKRERVCILYADGTTLEHDFSEIILDRNADARKQADALAAKHNKPVAVVPLTRLQFIPIFAAALEQRTRQGVHLLPRKPRPQHMTEAATKALARLSDLSRKAAPIRQAIARFKETAVKHGALDAPIDYLAVQDLHDRLQDHLSTAQLLLYNLQAISRDKPNT